MDWLNGVGLALGFFGALLMFFYGVPRYPSKESAGHNVLRLEQDDPDEAKTVKRADLLGRGGLVLLAVGFLLQFVALVCG